MNHMNYEKKVWNGYEEEYHDGFNNRDKNGTIQLLKSRIEEENSGNYVRVDFLYDLYDRAYRFDLVELNNKDEIKKLYVICSSKEYDKKLNALYKQLKLYQRVTKAEVFLAIGEPFLNGSVWEASLRVVSLRELEKTINDRWLVAKSFSDFYNILNELKKSQIAFWATVFFRGQSNIGYEPVPGIFRGKSINNEDRIYHEAIRRKPSEFTEDMTTFDHLVKMQHYELPTRLLDTSTNPLVALYFACQESKNEEGLSADGEVLIYPMLKEQIEYFDGDSVCVLANLAKRPSSFNFTNDKDYLIYDIQKDKPKFDGKYMKEDAIHKVLCVLPKLNNDRIVNQNGAFFIFGMGEKKNEPASIPELPYIINIKADAKQGILEELKIMGIDESSLFPETDKVMRQIKYEFA